MSANPKGYGAPYVRIWSNGREITERVVKFKYRYSAEGPDECTVEYHGSFSRTADNPAFSEGAVWRILYGYVGGRTTSRICVAQDINTKYSENGVNIVVDLRDQASVALINDVKNRTSKSQSLDQSAREIAEDNNLDYENDTKGSSDDPLNFFDRYNQQDRTFYPEGSPISPWQDPEEVRRAIETMKFSEVIDSDGQAFEVRATTLIAINPYIKDQLDNETSALILNEEEVRDDRSSSLTHLQKLANEALGGPYEVETRDNKITIKKRNYDAPPVRGYKFGGGAGELIEFSPNSSNFSFKRASSRQRTYQEDGEGKAIVVFDDSIENNPENSSGDAVQGRGENIAQEPLPTFSERLRNGLLEPPEEFRDPNYLENTRKAIEENTQRIKRGNYIKPVAIRDRTAMGNKFFVFQDERGQKSQKPRNTTGPLADIASDGGSRQKSEGTEAYKGNVSSKDAASGPDAWAANSRSSAASKKNGSYAKVVGEPLITSGQTVFISGVAIKHTGKYYVAKSEHIIDFNSGYHTILTLVTNKEDPNAKDKKKNKDKAKNKEEKSPKKKITPRPAPSPTPQPKPEYLVELEGWIDDSQYLDQSSGQGVSKLDLPPDVPSQEF